MRFVLILLMTVPLLASTHNELVIFSDSPDGDQLYDSSWGYVTPPSELELAGNNDKFPVETEVVFQGAHSLRLHWTSNPDGDWGIAVASSGWKGMDFTQYDSLVFWMNGEEYIDYRDFPELALEDLSNSKTDRILLGDFTDSIDEDITTWQRVSLPIEAFPNSGGADFTRIKTIFFYQSEADGFEHLAYLDEIRAIQKNGGTGGIPATPVGLSAAGFDSRIDVHWTPNTEENLAGYYVFAAENDTGPFTRLNDVVHEPMWYSDFFGENDATRFYYITAVNRNFEQSPPSDTVSATSKAMSEADLLLSVQEATFRYFYDYGHPVSGLARERKGSGNTCASGGTGFGLMNFPLAVENGFISRDSAAARVLKIARFLKDKAVRHHGTWSHWIHGETGEIIPFSPNDDGADLVETAYVIQGLLTVRQYFNGDSAVETEIRDIATQLWHEVEWDWFRKETNEPVLYWHWSPRVGWEMNMPIRGFNEAMIVYILAIASPTHPVPQSLYYSGWATSNYENGNEYYGIKQFVGSAYGGPLFFTHYTFLGVNPHEMTDNYCNYFENNRNISLIHQAYCEDNPKEFSCYSKDVWGLTASDDPFGYSAHSPTNDNGTITPTAAISAMPYTPEESLAALKAFYYIHGENLWGEFGFKDAFNCSEAWYAESYLAIDQGTIGPMIENYRTGLIWDLFMSNEEIQTAIKLISDVEQKEESVKSYGLLQNYPNPFNPSTTIEFYLPQQTRVDLEVINLLGEQVASLYHETVLMPGTHTIEFEAENLTAGLYFCRLRSEEFVDTHKMLLVK
mgnify:CR=1 FL=1